MAEKKPIFIQIKEFYEHLIDIGALKEGEEMPSVRAVALENNANPNTVQRAFSLMVDEGYLESIPKKGFYVQKKKVNRKSYAKAIIEKLMSEGYEKDEIIKIMEELDND
jgi:GntR family transcriptional regulator